MSTIDGMWITWLTIARGFGEAIQGDDADRTGMRSGGRHETEYAIDEWPIAVEKCIASVDQMLKNGPDMREGS